MDRLEIELELVKRRYPNAQLGSTSDHLLIPDWPLPAGWNQMATVMMILIPPGYPQTPPDCFYVDDALRLVGGGIPGNAGPGNAQLGKTWLWFSYHVEVSDWKPMPEPTAGANLLTFLLGVERRFEEAS